MGLHFQRHTDGTAADRDTHTETETDTGLARRPVREDAYREHAPPRQPTPRLHRFALLHDEFDDVGFGHERYETLRTRPPGGCEPVDRGGFALKCERPGRTLLDAVSDTVGEIRREHGLVMNSLGIEDPGERLDSDRNGYDAQIVAHLLLTAAHRAALLGYRRKDLVRLLDAAGAV
ncbi:hypothetical protein [Streptomyces sp. CAI-85]|uniref:hypothetical protein n=1 Tax=Streptomyces sp. CAI-85 TaxID=1472662 RepID=UPI001587648C|nr:hypothetical protein [Streptomyces sp. CAI-85]NUV60424.1 hypothetical protein [Streptomyces sp. CAI-85]